MYRHIISLMSHSASAAAFPQFIAAGAVSYDGTDPGSITPAIPAHQADDIIVVSARNRFNDTISVSGWNTIATATGPISSGWFWTRATNSSTTAPTVTAATRFLYGLCYVIRGCVTTGDPFENSTVLQYQNAATPNGDETKPYTSAIATTGPKRLVCAFVSKDDDISWATPPPPIGWTALAADVLDSNAVGQGFSLTTLEQATATTVPQIQLGTWNAGTTFWSSLTVAFIPA